MAEDCDSIKQRGTNIFYNTSRLPQDEVEAFSRVLESWFSTDQQQVKLTLILHN